MTSIIQQAIDNYDLSDAILSIVIAGLLAYIWVTSRVRIVIKRKR